MAASDIYRDGAEERHLLLPSKAEAKPNEETGHNICNIIFLASVAS